MENIIKLLELQYKDITLDQIKKLLESSYEYGFIKGGLSTLSTLEALSKHKIWKNYLIAHIADLN